MFTAKRRRLDYTADIVLRSVLAVCLMFTVSATMLSRSASAADPSTTAPVVSVDNPTSGRVKGPVEVRISASDDNLRHYWYKVQRNDVVIAEQVVLSDNISNHVVLTLNAEGKYKVTVAARDKTGGTASSGNRSNDVIMEFVIDNTVPNGSFTYSNGGAGRTNSPVTVTLSASEPIQTPAGWTKVDDKTYTLVVSGNGGADITIADLANNTRTLHYQVSGIDMTAPVFSVVNGAAIQVASIEITVTESEIDKVYVDGTEVAVSGSGPNYAVPVNGEGAHTVRATDKSGNDVSVSFVLDQTAPTVELNDIAAVTVGSKVSVSGKVTDDPAVARGEILVDGQPITDGEIDIVDGAFSFVIAGLSIGSHEVSVRASDTAGNVGVSPVKLATVRGVPVQTTTDTTTTSSGNGETPATPAESESGLQIFRTPLLASQAILGDQAQTSPDAQSQTSASSDVATAGKNQDVEGAADEKHQQATGGMAWYWWILIGAGAVALWLVFAALSRSRRAQ